MPVDDPYLLSAARLLDQAALSSIFDLYSPAIYRYALRLCRNPIQADDIVGEVFSRLIIQFQAGKGPTDNLRSYLYQTAYHLVVDVQRKDHLVTDLEDPAFPRDWGLPVSISAENKSLAEKLYEAIRNVLTPDQQQVIILRFLEGLSLQETADIIGKEVNNIKVIQNRAIARLRMNMNQEDLKDFE